ncbi:MAG: hypothetical protein IKY52_03295 [Clostridia bacterium]|nr:hypothetical protein [Clostridia bacterium]
MFKRSISLALVLCMMLAALAGCGDAAQENAVGDTAAVQETEAETKDALAARLDVSDNLPEADFGGSTFMICGDDAYLSHYVVEEQTGEVVNDAVFQRNLNVQERYNVSIDANVFPETDIMKNVKNSVLAADDAYQMIACHIIMQGMAAVDGTMYNWYDLPHVNFDQPWWSDSTTEDLTYKNMAFIAIGDFGLSSISSTYCMFYNKDLAVEYNLPNMYEVVANGDWTLDKMMELCDGVYTDLNGDGTRDLADKHGLITDCKSAANSYLWAFGKKIATQKADGTYDLSYYDDKLVSIVEKMYNLYYESGYVFTDPTSWGDAFVPAFTEGRAMFFNGQFRHAVGTLRDVEFDFGIIPYPKWDDAQDNYYTSVDGGHEGLAIPKSVQDKEYIGIMAEVLNAESWKLVVPAYYDTALKYKGARDEESIAIIDMLMEARIFDFGYVYGGWGCVFWLQYMMEGATKDITSYYEKNFGAYEKTMEKVFEAFDTYTVE